jgi:DNA-binding beta-propeller fold protein YncE
MRVTATLGLAVASAAALLAGEPRGVAAEPALTVEAKIPLGAVRGRIDHLAVDLARRRVFVAELGNGSVSAVDLAAGRVERRIAGLAEPQGVAYVPGADLLYVASGGDGTLRRYRGADLAAAGEPLKLGADADNVRVAAGGERIVVGYGDGALATLDAASGRTLGEVRLPAHPESFRIERSGARAFVNLPNARQVGVVDLAAGKPVGHWTLDGAALNFPMALDEAAGRLFVVYRRPAVLAVFDTRSGALVARLPTVGDADDVFVDEKRGRIYVSGGEGAVAVVAARGDGYEETGRLPTVPGARTSLFVPELDRLYLAVRAAGSAPAALWVLRPAAGS